MLDGNAVAERLHDKPIDEAYELDLSRRALDELVDRMFHGESFPRKAPNRIDLIDILNEADGLPEAVARVLLGDDDLGVEADRIVRRYLDDSQWHHEMIAQLREDDRESA